MPKHTIKKCELSENLDTASQVCEPSIEEEADMLAENAEGADEDANLTIILKELREFRKDNGQQLKSTKMSTMQTKELSKSRNGFKRRRRKCRTQKTL